MLRSEGYATLSNIKDAFGIDTPVLLSMDFVVRSVAMEAGTTTEVVTCRDNDYCRCGCQMTLIKPTPLKIWSCDCPSHTGRNQFTKEDDYYGCPKAKECDYGFCKTCWLKACSIHSSVVKSPIESSGSCRPAVHLDSCR